MEETFFSLLASKSHWFFEIFTTIVFDVIIIGFLYPLLVKAFNHHKEDDNKLEQLDKRLEKLENR